MSFGFSISDAITLTKIASRTVENARKACGAHDELTRELSSLQLVLRRLKQETAKAESPINRPDDPCQDELQSLIVGCEKLLTTFELVLVKYNSLSQEERSGRKLWQRIRFGNGEMQDLGELRSKAIYFTSAISLFLNMISVGSIGRVEQRMNEAGGELREIRLAVNGITAHLLSGTAHEGTSTLFTTYAEDDKTVWKEFRRELLADGFTSQTINRYKQLIKAYIGELATRGLLDEEVSCDEKQRQDEEGSHHGEELCNNEGEGFPDTCKPSLNVVPMPASSIKSMSAQSPQSQVPDIETKASLESREPLNKPVATSSKGRTSSNGTSPYAEGDSVLNDINIGLPSKFGPNATGTADNSEADGTIGRAPPAWLMYDEVDSHILQGSHLFNNGGRVFLAAPYGICGTTYNSMALGFNLSLILWQYRWRLENVQKCLHRFFTLCNIASCDYFPDQLRCDLIKLQKFLVVPAVMNSYEPICVPLDDSSFPIRWHRRFLSDILARSKIEDYARDPRNY